LVHFIVVLCKTTWTDQILHILKVGRQESQFFKILSLEFNAAWHIQFSDKPDSNRHWTPLEYHETCRLNIIFFFFNHGCPGWCHRGCLNSQKARNNCNFRVNFTNLRGLLFSEGLSIVAWYLFSVCYCSFYCCLYIFFHYFVPSPFPFPEYYK